ncbi:type II secretion system protein GspL [Pedomonas mirosovicensis]|uniref:type II secretion system protein GspL n=1 Tax=Pedomonas mirosovicensis TaxID=2908641 RepID=UPI0021687534|nr:type II secretion system protein GspL [Pedomonas mirosovicensis]MCH8686340.1 type II secretion system protein GspL [Pedomonas mirosovicensis]
MTTVLLIAFAEEAMPWAVFANGALTSSGTGLETLPPAPTAQVWLVVPGMDVTVRPVTLPPKGEAKLRAMLPFVLEDELAVGADGLHFALSGPREEGARLAGVVAREKMEAWLAALSSAGRAPDVVTPDFLALPPGMHGAGNTVAVRHDGGGYAIEREIAADLLQEALPPPLAQQELLQKFHDAISAEVALNLLQGPYVSRRRQTVEWGRWRQPALLAATVAAAHLLYLGIDGWRHGRAVEQLDQQAEAVLRAAFPDIKRIVNPQAQMRARLGELRGGSSDRFLRLMRILLESLQPLEGMSVRTLRFDEAKGELAVEIAYARYDELEALKQAISGAGGALSEGSSRQNGGGMVGNVIVRMP